jgi:hypothetical protein
MFKESQIYGWDSEPVDERPSEFMASGGYSVLSSDRRLDAAISQRRARSRVRFGGFIAFLVALFAVGIYAVVALLPLLTKR